MCRPQQQSPIRDSCSFPLDQETKDESGSLTDTGRLQQVNRSTGSGFVAVGGRLAAAGTV